MGFFTRCPPSRLGTRNQLFPSAVVVHLFVFVYALDIVWSDYAIIEPH
nr:hypothetical protein BAR15_180085 [Bartonella sp. AR 15-3]